MANHGSKFVSVNLNKSYGQQHQPSHHSTYPSFNGGSYGQAAGRGRTGGGVSGGMVVLSRNRGPAPKAVPKLSVPPPLNLPSLRKEHEKFDALGPGGGPGGGAGSGSGSRPASSGVGWTKPVAATNISQKNESGVDLHGFEGMDATGVASRGGGSYMPPSTRSNGIVAGSGPASQDFPSAAGKATVLKGEDFPSLQDARPSSSGASQKQRDVSNQKQKLAVRDELTQDKRSNYHLGPSADVHSVVQSSQNTFGNGSVEKGDDGHVMGNIRKADQVRKKEDYFPDPLPLVRLNPRSDWADDERDISHGFVEHGRDTGYSKSESYWDRDFDLPRPSALPHKLAQLPYDRRVQRDNETGKNTSSEVLRVDPYPKDLRASSREGREANSWRTSSYSKDGSNFQVGTDRRDAGGRMGVHNDMVKENKYIPPHHGDAGRDGNTTLYRDSTSVKRDSGVVGRQHQWNYTIDSYNNRGTEHNPRDRYGTEQSNRYRGDNFQNKSFIKSSPVSSGKMLQTFDSILNIGRDKRSSKGDRQLAEDPFSRDFSSAGFDETDLFSGSPVGVIKKKKDAVKSTDFHDPVRESFEAELERVQKMQELERRRIIEEQERALEQARREEEERERRIREEEERQRKVEEEAREAAWREEQERLEAIRKAEEQKIAREEERRRIQLEEERRKQAAKQKLLELEARMAKRQAEAAVGDAPLSSTIMNEKLEATVKETDVTRTLDLDTWEEGERMVEKMTTSSSYDSPTYGRPLEMSMRPYPPREGSSNFPDRGKDINSWRRDVFDKGAGIRSPIADHEIGHYSPKRDAFGGGRALPRKELHRGAGYMSSRSYTKDDVPEPFSDEFGFQKDHRWNLSMDADSYGKFREMDSEFSDGVTDRYAEDGLGQGHSRAGNRSLYPERLYPHPEANELYPYGRSRYSMRQPRVLPPPTLASVQRSNFRGVAERSGPSAFLDSDSHYAHAGESTRQPTYYRNDQGDFGQSEIVGLEQESTSIEDQNLNTTRCDSQSSLSVSSPPTSPPHMSHDELDESGDSRVPSAVAEGVRSSLTTGESVVVNENFGKATTPMSSDSISAVEDEEWTFENDLVLQQQEEYDVDEDGFREEDEVREGVDGNHDLNQKFEGLELDKRESPLMLDNVVLGFDEGVEVAIPNDDFEKNLGGHETSIRIPDSSVNLEECQLVDGVPSCEQNLLPGDDSSGKCTDVCSGKIPEPESVSQGSIGQPVGSAPSSSSTSGLLSSSSGLPSQQTLSSSGDNISGTDLVNLPPVSSFGRTKDIPVQLQFGLFSGPSLIPSPVPAIQIGSIQMPLHIHPSVSQSLSHMHSSQPPMFQFGQLRYTPPASQSMAAQSISFVQPNVPSHVNLNQNVEGAVPHQPVRNAAAQNVSNDKVPSRAINEKPSFVSAQMEQSNVSNASSRELNFSSKADSSEDTFLDNATSSGASGANDKRMKPVSASQAEEKGPHEAVLKGNVPSSNERGSERRLHQPKLQSVTGEKIFSGHRGPGLSSGGRGKRFAYAVKNANTRSSSQPHDMPSDTNGFERRPRRIVQRTEFRIRDNNDRRQGPLLGSSNNRGSDDKSNYLGKTSGGFTRSGSKRGTISTRTMKQRVESEPLASGNIISQEVNSGFGAVKEKSKVLLTENHNNATVAEDVDAPLQSGVVRVFKQPGIEAPSDEDDFIEVRSKRQMLNDRREQREKEIKEKSRITKPLRKQRFTRQNNVTSTSASKLSMPLVSEQSKNSDLGFTASGSPCLANNEVSIESTAATSLAPIGTPAVRNEAQASRSVSVVSNDGPNLEPGLTSESKNKVEDLTPASSTAWSAVGKTHQVMSLPQPQLDDAIKPARYGSLLSTVGGHSISISDPILPTSSISTKDKTFSSDASPVNSLLAGRKIQFGAVTSPTVLPPSSRAVSHAIGAPGSNRPDVQMSHNFPVSENERSLFYEKEKHLSDPCIPLHDCEAEAEAAASAVAVAAISSDEMVGTGLGSANVPETKIGADADIDGITTGVVGDQQSASLSRSEDSLSVSLPADLSVETTPISLWPPLPSPQSSSSQMVSHFPGGPSSHFPFYEMNPMLGGPLFAFGPHEESSGTQSQSQKSAASTSGPLGNWQQCHSGMDSFYGPPAGYPGPFISPHGGIPGVQGPPHMVVYNHFAPVGQYGQVGLSFMGTTYIPSGKQADWKHVSSTSAMHIGEGDINNINMTSLQRGAPNVTSPIQHLAPGSPLLPMGSPMPMFDLSPFQSTADLSVQARWGHIPAASIHSVPASRPLQVEGGQPSTVNHGHTIVDQSLTVNRFPESRVPAPSENGASFTVAPDTNVSPFTADLGLVDSLVSTSVSSGQSIVAESTSSITNSEPGKGGTPENRFGNNGKQQHPSSLKSQFFHKNSLPQQSSSGYNYQRTGMANRNNAGNEWSHRRMGFHGRKQSSGTDKGFPGSKMKQIYVAKQTTSTNSTN